MRKLCVFLTMFFQGGKPSRRMCVLHLFFCLLITFCSSTVRTQLHTQTKLASGTPPELEFLKSLWGQGTEED
jgi:hypothetical protein